MKTLYLDCSMGAAGDMLTAALLGVVPDPDGFVKKFNSIGIPGVTMKTDSVKKCGITGKQVTVSVFGEVEGEHEHEHHHVHDHEQEHLHHHKHDPEHEHEHGHHPHTSLSDIEHIVDGLPLDADVKKDVLAVYTLIAEAESAAHGVSVSEIHFHEVGTLDAVADITAVCMLMKSIGAQSVISSPVHVGSGSVRCAHGVIPVPAPATEYILRGCPIYGGQIRGELCTPTGAALLRHFCSDFGEMPVIRADKVGYGMGKKDFERVNCLRAFLGETDDGIGERVTEFECTLDDITPERLAYAADGIVRAGALDVYTLSAVMKKGRSGHILHVICAPAERERVLRSVYALTTTRGVREYLTVRHKQSERYINIETEYGLLKKKISEGYSKTNEKYEFDDISRLAREAGVTPDEVERAARRAEEKSEY